MIESPVAIRDYRPSDEPAILALLRQALGTGRAFDRTSEFWRWKHFRNPFGPSLLVVAEREGIVGLRAFLRWRFVTPSVTLQAVRAVDTATHPSLRRHGIFAALTRHTVERARRDGIDLIFNTPNQHSLPGYLKLGWTYLGRPGLLVRILRPARCAGALLGLERDGDRGRSQPGSPAVPVAALLADDVVDRLLAEHRRHGEGIRTARDREFFTWRYGAVPSLRYYACVRGEGSSTAAVIFRLNRRHGLREIMVCELLLGIRGSLTAPAVLADLREAADGDYIIAHARRGSAVGRVLRHGGFIPLPRVGPHLAVRPLSQAAEHAAATRPEQWSLSLGDLEVF